MGNDRRWATNLADFREYVRRSGNTLPPAGTRGAGGSDLHCWAGNARATYRRGALAASRAADLEAIPGWVWRTRSPRSFYGNGAERRARLLADLVRVLQERGRIPALRATPTATPEQRHGGAVYNFSLQLRQEYAAGRLDAEVVDRLNAQPGWSWDLVKAPARSVAEFVASYRAFLHANGFRPGVASGDHTEKRLAQRLYELRGAYAAGDDTDPVGMQLAGLEAEASRYPSARWLRCFRRHVGLLSDESTPGPAAAYSRTWLRSQRDLELLPPQARALLDRAGHLIAARPKDGTWRQDLEVAQQELAAGRLSKKSRDWARRTRGRMGAGALSAAQEAAAGPVLDAAGRLSARKSALAKANSARKVAAAARDIARAQAALAQDGLPADLRRMLQARADAPPECGLQELAGRVGVTKDVFAGRLRRALAGVSADG